MSHAANRIKEDLSNLDALMRGFDKMLDGAAEDLRLDGKNIEKANVEQVALYAYYDQNKAYLAVMMEDMEMRNKVARALAIKKIQDNSGKDYGERILNQMIENDPLVRKTGKALMEIKERYSVAKTVMDSFTQRGYALNLITKLRIADLQDITIYADD